MDTGDFTPWRGGGCIKSAQVQQAHLKLKSKRLKVKFNLLLYFLTSCLVYNLSHPFKLLINRKKEWWKGEKANNNSKKIVLPGGTVSTVNSVMWSLMQPLTELMLPNTNRERGFVLLDEFCCCVRLSPHLSMLEHSNIQVTLIKYGNYFQPPPRRVFFALYGGTG